MKLFTEQQIDDLLKLKFGGVVTSLPSTSYVPNRVLGKIFGVSRERIRQLYLARFEANQLKSKSLMERLQQSQSPERRKRYGYRFLKKHEIQWLISANVLRRQTSLSLVDRCKAFKREFPDAKMNPTLLRHVYQLHKIKKKKFRWYKTPKEPDSEKTKQALTTMKRLLTQAKNGGYRIVYIDETMFTRKTLQEAEWSRPKENMAVDLEKLDEPTLALLSGVSKEKG